MKNKPPKLPLTPEERTQLRKHKIRTSEIADLEPDRLAAELMISVERAESLIANAHFQRLPDIGPNVSLFFLDLGFTKLEQLKDHDPAELLNTLEKRYGYWVDPCCEDCIRLVVHFAQHPDADKRWWDFTAERKAYRAAHGYPADRPAKSWMDA